MDDKLLTRVITAKGAAQKRGPTEELDVDFADREIERQVRSMVKSSQDKYEKQLRSDDYVDYIVLAALVLVAVFGIGMWSRLKEQQKTLLL